MKYINRVLERRVKIVNNIQQKILEIFTEIDKICVRHNLRYYAIGGTCLGAVRHHGFIPWDDDMDIAMPEKDFEAFMNIAPKELPDNLKLISSDVLCERALFFAKVHDVETTFIECYRNGIATNYSGIYVDIMPLGGAPRNKLQRRMFCNLIDILLRFNEKKYGPFNVKRTVDGKLLWIGMKPVNIFLSHNFYINLWKKLTSKYKFDDSQYIAFVWSFRIKSPDRVFKKEWFDDYVMLPFENINMRCPCNWDAYLTRHFGDYMKMPPVEEQEFHCSDGGIIDINQSYKIYQRADKNVRSKKGK